MLFKLCERQRGLSAQRPRKVPETMSAAPRNADKVERLRSHEEAHPRGAGTAHRGVLDVEEGLAAFFSKKEKRQLFH